MPYWECNTCGREFENRNNLIMHKLIHRSASFECIGCDRMFKTYGGMLIHLEYGTCASGIDRYDINRTAAMLYQWKKFIDKPLRWELLSKREPSEKAFSCPACGQWFGKLSGLFQHIESPACDATLDSAVVRKLMGWIRKRHC